MNILLLNPYNHSYVVMPSIGLGYLASVLRKEGHRLHIINCIKDKLKAQDINKFVIDNDIHIVGFQLFSYDMNLVQSYLKIIKAASSTVITIAGGAHPSGDPQSTLDLLPELDYAFRGEAEIGLPPLVNLISSGSRDDKELEKIPGLIWRCEEEVVVNPIALVQDLDSLDFPSWDLLEPHTYPEASHGAFAKNFPTAPIITTRGCPYQCTFCAAQTIASRKIRVRDVDNVLAEIGYLVTKFGIKEIHIEDDNFTVSRKYVYDFCEKIKLIGDGKISWSLPAGVRIDSLDSELIKIMEEAGCYSLALGIEFGTQKLLNLTKKKITLDMIREKVALFEKSRIKTTGFFLLGYPGETEEDIKATIEFSHELPILRAQYNNFMPLPGSEIYEDLRKQGKLGEMDWDNFFVHKVCHSTGLDEKKMAGLQRRAYLGFYLRRRIMFNILSEIKSPRHVLYLLNRFLDACHLKK